MRPYVDDGKHGVVFSDGRQKRRDIDTVLVQKYGLKINPVLPRDGGEPPARPATTGYTIVGLLPDPAKLPATITLRSRTGGASLVVDAVRVKPLTGDAAVIERWARARTASWGSCAGRVSPSRRRIRLLAGLGQPSRADRGRRRARRDRDGRRSLGLPILCRGVHPLLAVVRLGLPGLFATESEQRQLAAVKGMAALLPLLLTVSPDPQDASARHAALFGWRPMHPGPGEWVWKDGEISSSVYGTVDHPRQPPYSADAGDFGLFQGVDRLRVNMQLEGDGLRAAVRWRWTGREE